MIECSLGRIDGAIIRKALSGFTFVEFDIPVDSYNDSPKFTLSTDGSTIEYKIVGSEVFMRPGEQTLVKISAIKADQEKWLTTNPASYEETDIQNILKGLNIEDGPNLQVSLLNLFLNDGQFAIMLANMTPKTAFVDFEKQKVVYYSELYKQKARIVKVPFRRLYGRSSLTGYIGWEESNIGAYQDDMQNIIPFGQFNNIDRTTLDNLVNNCNEINKMCSDIQMFVLPEPLELGSTVLSQLTLDKRVVVAVEEQWDSQTSVNTYYTI